MSLFTPGNAPGLQPKTTADDAQITWSGRQGADQTITRRVTIDDAAVDAGNTPSTTLRAGLVLAVQDADGKAAAYDPDANNGRQIAVGVLEQGQSMLVDGVAKDRFAQMLVGGMVKESQLIGLDGMARRQLSERFVFDRAPLSLGGSLTPRGVYRKAADYTLVAADNGLLFVATAAVTFTLPTAAHGLAFRFVQTADANLVLQGSLNIVHKGNAAASSVTFNTASQKIGSSVLVECLYIAENTLRWVVTNLGGTTATVA